MTPLKDDVLINPDSSEITTEGGLVVQAEQGREIHFGTVEGVGPGRSCRNGARAPMTVRPGHRVMFWSYAGTPVETDEGQRLVMSESDLLAVVS